MTATDEYKIMENIARKNFDDQYTAAKLMSELGWGTLASEYDQNLMSEQVTKDFENQPRIEGFNLINLK